MGEGVMPAKAGRLEADASAVAIDYETYYEDKTKSRAYSLAKMPTWQYCADPRFDAYLVAICGWGITDDGKFDLVDKADADGSYTFRRKDGSLYRQLPDGRQLYVGRPENFDDWEELKGRLCLAHNASFDQVVTVELAKRGKIPAFMGEQRWACTADMSAYLAAPRNLKGAMKELFGKDISKEVRAAMDGRHDWELDEKERRDLVEYGGSDAVECHDLWLKYSKDWPYVERRVSELNRLSTMRGILMDVEYAKKAKKELESYLSVVLCDIPWYPEKSAGSLPALKQAVLAMGLTCPKSFKKDDPGFLRWVDRNGNVPFIKARQQAISIQMCIARLNTMIETADPEGRSHIAFLYFGAHTGRFSGRSESGGNLNLLNLPRKPVMAGDEHVFGGEGVKIRECYMAGPGRRFAVYDYSQIERRFVLWAVDDQKMLEGVKREGNLYEASAVEMGWCEPHSHIKKTNPGLYLKAKQCELGLGYGMSWPKFLDTCKTAGLDLDPLPVDQWPDIVGGVPCEPIGDPVDRDGHPCVAFTPGDRRLRFMLRNVAHVKGDFYRGDNVRRVGQLLTAKRIVEDWRRANRKTVDFWAELAQRFKERAMEGKPTVSFRMPSGRVKTYYNPQFVKEPTTIVDDDGKERQDYRVAIAAQVVRGGPMNYFTGGSLAENLTQACCRDILMNAIVEIADTHPSWKYVFNVYDECIFSIPEGDAEEAQAEIPRIMTKGDRIREWTEGLMLEVEGDICERYHK
jgi:hypothetical protein